MGPATVRSPRAAATLDELRAGAPLAIGGVSLVVVEHVRAQVAVERGHLVAEAARRVEAVVIVDRRGRRAVDLEGRPLDLEALRSHVAGLGEALQGLTVSPPGSSAGRGTG